MGLGGKLKDYNLKTQYGHISMKLLSMAKYISCVHQLSNKTAHLKAHFINKIKMTLLVALTIDIIYLGINE